MEGGESVNLKSVWGSLQRESDLDRIIMSGTKQKDTTQVSLDTSKIT